MNPFGAPKRQPTARDRPNVPCPRRRAPQGRGSVGVAAAAATALGVGVMSIAAPPAAALALIPLVDVLAQGRGKPADVAARSLWAAPAQG
jgi:hypothetical protein